MAQSTSTSQSRPNLGLNASRGPKPATEHRMTDRPRRKWKAIQHEEIQKGKELRLQNWAKRRERLDEVSALNPEISKALDIKECLLDVQATLIGKLTVKENHTKGLVETPDPSEINFDEMVKDVEEVIRALQY